VCVCDPHARLKCCVCVSVRVCVCACVRRVVQTNAALRATFVIVCACVYMCAGVSVCAVGVKRQCKHDVVHFGITENESER
jgi:hypothetical protein